MRKRTILAIVLGVVLLASLIAGGVMVLAADPQTTPTPTPAVSPQDAFLKALAAKLNIPVDQLKSAITAAETETMTQAVKDRLQSLVSAGKMTQQQADQYLQWWQSSPNLPAGLGLPGIQEPAKGFGRGMMGHGRAWGGGPCFQQPATLPAPRPTST